MKVDFETAPDWISADFVSELPPLFQAAADMISLYLCWVVATAEKIAFLHSCLPVAAAELTTFLQSHLASDTVEMMTHV